MLERTAASLESCALQRLLPRPGRSIKSRRQLHTGFWQHGAAAIELAGLWPPPPGVPEPAVADAPPGPPQPSLLASTFLLEFLYPNGTRALLQRLSPFLSRSRDAHAAPRRCFISTSAPSYRQNSDKQAQGAEVVDAPNGSSAKNIEQERMAASPALVKLLSRSGEDDHGDIWLHFSNLEKPEQLLFAKEVALYLAKIDNFVAKTRAKKTFFKIPQRLRDNEVQAGYVELLLHLGDPTHAKSLFRDGLAKLKLTGGLDHIMMYVIKGHQWEYLVQTWLNFAALRSPGAPSLKMCDLEWINLSRTSNLAKHYFAFEEYLEQIERGNDDFLHAINIHPTSRHNLQLLRRKLAFEALKKNMAARTYQAAAAILDLWGDSQLYEAYITTMLERLASGLESRGNLTMLADVYKKYRVLPGVKPSIFILHGMFEYFASYDARALQDVYQDWHEAWGDLDRWGYEKYLDSYAQAGNAPAVKYLWDRYVAKFPELLKLPSTFCIIVKAHAIAGDAEKAEREVRVMSEQYGVLPDINIWNALLQCYVMAEDDISVAHCFEDIKRIDRPNTATYALLMNFAARRGDLRAVLEYFQQSQDEDLSVDVDVAKALVTAYCRNDRLVAAEKICRELAVRHKATTEMWNQVLVYNGVQGKLHKVQDLLLAMKQYGIAWNYRTHDALLQALVKAKDMLSAYRLMADAEEKKIFHICTDHLETIASGALRINDTAYVDALLRKLENTGEPISFNTQVLFAESAMRNAPTSNRARDMAKGLVEGLRALLPPVWDEAPPLGVPPPYHVGNVRELGRKTRLVGQALSVMVSLREFPAAEEMVKVYSELFPQYKGNPFPPQIAAPLMQGYLNDAQFDRVIDMWNTVFEALLARSMDPRTENLYPAYAYNLNAPLLVVILAFKGARDGPGLANCIERLNALDFKLLRSSWNLAVSTLAELGQLEKAMYWCERMLMHAWPGWERRDMKAEERRKFRNPRVLQPSRPAVTCLQMEWIKLRKLAAWSGDVSNKLKAMEQNYPRMHHAFTTNDYEHLPAAWVMPKRPSLNQALRDMLKPLSYRELLAMRRALVQQRRAIKLQRLLRSVLSPFQVAQAKYRSQVITKAFSGQQLKKLESELRKRIGKARKGADPAAESEPVRVYGGGGGSVPGRAVAGRPSSAGRRFISTKVPRRSQSTLRTKTQPLPRVSKRRPNK